MFLLDKCEHLACSTRRVYTSSRPSDSGLTWTFAISLLPFITTFFGFGSVLLYKIFPLISQQKDESCFCFSLCNSRGAPLLSLPNRTTYTAQDAQMVGRCRIVALTFSTTIALAAVLAELILCEISNTLDPVARAFALKSIVPSLLFSLVLLIPFLVIQSIISSAGWAFKYSGNNQSSRIAWLLQACSFSLWLFSFWWLGKGTNIFTVASKPGKGLNAACLERVGIIGIALMAQLSGFAAVSAIWHTFGTRLKTVSEADISRKQETLNATNELLALKQSRLRLLQRKVREKPSEGFMTKVLGITRGNSDAQEISSVNSEISGLIHVVSSLSSSVNLLRNRLAYGRRSSSIINKMVMEPISYGFSIYYIYRIVTAIFTNAQHLIFSSSNLSGYNPSSSDPINRILTLVTKHVDPTLNQLAWSRQLSFFLSGVILLASFKSVLTTFHMLTKISPSLVHQAETNLALFIAQISATYVISSALLLRSSLPTEMKSIVKDALGSPLELMFVDRWFDSWFLLATMGTAVGLWVSRNLYGQGDSETWDDLEFKGDIELGQKRQ